MRVQHVFRFCPCLPSVFSDVAEMTWHVSEDDHYGHDHSDPVEQQIRTSRQVLYAEVSRFEGLNSG